MRSSTGAPPRCWCGIPITVAVSIFLFCAFGHLVSEVVAQDAEVSVQVNTARLDDIDDAVNTAIRNADLPGAIVLISHHGQIIYHKAFGRRAVQPIPEAMTPDTIFDLASLTKVVATAPAVMMLVEDGLISLRDPVARYIPGFERHDKDQITVEHLLTHMSGLRPDFPLDEEFQGYQKAIAQAIEERPVHAAGTQFVYSDINFIVLAEIVARISGTPFDQFVDRRLFSPLRMTDTGFLPSPAEQVRVAPTESCRPFGWPCGDEGSVMLRGVVHDPTARRMGGIAGHAGLFGTADDLARYGGMLLANGMLDEVHILSPLSVARMTRPATTFGMGEQRGLGWDISSRYSSNRGDLFSTGSYGHTGFTGTSIWIDPATQTVVVFLSNRMHPNGGGNVTALRGRVATLAAAAVTIDVARENESNSSVRTGIDRLRDENFSRLEGQRVGLVTNQTGRASSGSTTIDLLHGAQNVVLTRLFSPEHGIRGDVESEVADAIDPTTGLTIYSLYGDTRRPKSIMLDGLDTIVVDLQDAGARFYTYATTLGYMMEAAAERNIKVVVLDRPNPINGVSVEGPLLDDTLQGFTGYLSMPIRHGLTLGELAQVFNAERDIGVELEVVRMEGWRRRLWYDETGLLWINPSPNLRSVTQATLYPGIGSIEHTNLSVGRGTDGPFEYVGAPWIDGTRLAKVLNARHLDGVRFYPMEFIPDRDRYADELCFGVGMTVIDRDVMRPVRVGVEIAAALLRLYPNEFDLDSATRLVGSRATIQRIQVGRDPADIALDWTAGERQWRERIAAHLLYEP